MAEEKAVKVGDTSDRLGSIKGMIGGFLNSNAGEFAIGVASTKTKGLDNILKKSFGFSLHEKVSTYKLQNFPEAVDYNANGRSRYSPISMYDSKNKEYSNDKTLLSSMKMLNIMDKQKGFAQPNRFLIDIVYPKSLRDFTKANKSNGAVEHNMEVVGLLCQSISIPQKTLQTFEHKALGVPYRGVHGLNFEPITATFICDGEMEVRKFFEAWLNTIVDSYNNTLHFYDDYTTDIKITLFTREGKVLYQVVLEEAYPMNISNLDLSHNSNNTLLTMSCTFTYKRWIEIEV